MQKTLGGDRLGAGKKMTVDIPGFERSTHDLGYLFRTTMSAGTLVPFMSRVALPGDTWDINLDAHINTHPTVGPLFGSYKVQMDIFECPIRLYNALLHNNMLGIGRNIANAKLPQIQMAAENVTIEDQADINTMQINPSSLLAYLGIRGIGLQTTGALGTVVEREFNAVPILAMAEIYKNYYANKQEEIGAVIHNDNVAVDSNGVSMAVTNIGGTSSAINLVPPGAIQSLIANAGAYLSLVYTGTDPLLEQKYLQTNRPENNGSLRLDIVADWAPTATAGTIVGTIKAQYLPMVINGWGYVGAFDARNVMPKVVTFDLNNIDEMRNQILSSPNPAAPFIINDADLEPYKWLYTRPNGIANVLSSQEGLFVKTYNSDLFNNWLNSENIDAITTASSIDTSGGSFSMDMLAMAKNVYKYLNAINVSGGTYDDWLEVTYDHQGILRAESPIYCGGLIKELIFQEVISNSESESGQPLGTLAGRGTLSQKHKGGQISIRVNEPSYIIGLVSLTPRIDYSQGNNWDVKLQTLDDLHKPQFDQIGFQELDSEQLAWWQASWTGTAWEAPSVGKQPAWINYMTEINRTYGNFAIPDNEMFMTLNRRYETDQASGWQIKDLTTYIDPAKYNYIFAETALDAQNFWTQISVDITCRRKMSGKLMPQV